MYSFLQHIFLNMNRQAVERNTANIVRLLERNPDAVILDAGCDDGSFTELLRTATGSNQLFGIEVLEDRAQLAEQKGICVSKSDLTKRFDYPDNFFDVVHANQVIEHLYDIDNFVEEIARVLKPGGYCIISTENLASWHNIGALFMGKQAFSTHISKRVESFGNPFGINPAPSHKPQSMVHVKILTPSSLKAIFELYGFERCRVYGAGYYPFPAFLAHVLSDVNPGHAAYITLKAY